MSTMQTDTLYSPLQVAQKLGVHRITVYHWIKTGKLEASKYGGVWRVSESALDRMAEEGKNPKRRKRRVDGKRQYELAMNELRIRGVVK